MNPFNREAKEWLLIIIDDYILYVTDLTSVFLKCAKQKKKSSWIEREKKETWFLFVM